MYYQQKYTNKKLAKNKRKENYKETPVIYEVQQLAYVHRESKDIYLLYEETRYKPTYLYFFQPKYKSLILITILLVTRKNPNFLS